MPREGVITSQLAQHARVISRVHPAQVTAGRVEFLLTELWVKIQKIS